MPGYQLLAVGVLDLETDEPIPPNPSDERWLRYVEWTRTPGNVAQPAPGPTLEQRRATRSDAVNTHRERVLGRGFTFAGHLYDSDARSLANISAVAAGLGLGIPLPDGFTWRTADNEDVPMDGSTFAVFAATAILFGNEAYRRSWELKAQIAASDNPEAVDITAGWPGDPAPLTMPMPT